MSLLHTCPDCGDQYETGLNGSGGRCQACNRAASIISEGGRRLSHRERAAVADLLGGVVPEDDVPFVVDELVGALALDEASGVLDLATREGERAALVGVEWLPDAVDRRA